MKLKDIIKTDRDRLFMVDTECFIIFSGISINDDRPFIRIGTWYDLPVEIIPLVENIIITDSILGDPSHEQFNIDVRHFESNRYIGGESVTRRFLEYQRNFGLDLTNVSVVKIEKDIPELPNQQHISDRDQFIGIFYNDGNIKIVHDGTDIFNLNSIFNDSINTSEILNRLSANSKKTTRYSGSGFVLIDRNPFFYSNGYFTAYQFPANFYHDFSALQIDPNMIRELLLPSQNMLNISGLIKYKNYKRGKIHIFSDNDDQTGLIRRLFKNAGFKMDKFSGMNYNTGSGLEITSYNDTPNIRVNFEVQGNKVKISFIKSPSDIKKILKEKPDAVLITYTAYEEASLIFKSADIPVLIIDDGNPNVKKIAGSDRLVLKSGTQYELKNYDTIADIINDLTGTEKINQALESGEAENIESVFNELLNQPNNAVILINALTLLEININNTTNRKLFSKLSDIRRRCLMNPGAELEGNSIYRYKVRIALNRGSAYRIVQDTASESEEIFINRYNSNSIYTERISFDQKKLAEVIIEDRKRLDDLLKLFYDDKKITGTYENLGSEITLLKTEIDSRKEAYVDEFYSEFKSAVDIKKAKKFRKQGGKSGGVSDGKVSMLNLLLDNIRPANLKKNKFLILIPLLLLCLTVAGFFIFHRPKEKPVLAENDLRSVPKNQNVVFTVKRVDAQEKALLLKHGVQISELDVYNYANEVAVKNGYNPLSDIGLKNKNPHWIYPSNIFIMLDGEKVTVQQGDTLWDLSRAKLEKMSAEFYKLIEQIEKTEKSNVQKRNTLLNEAGKYAYITQQKKALEAYKSDKKDGR